MTWMFLSVFDSLCTRMDPRFFVLFMGPSLSLYSISRHYVPDKEDLVYLSNRIQIKSIEHP